MKLRRIIKMIFGGDRGEINPEDIFLDSSNLPEFDDTQFEGRIEKPFSQVIPYIVFSVFILIVVSYVFKTWDLQIVNGKSYAERSLNNGLRHTLIFSERGTITDRNGLVLATNDPAEEGNDFSKRSYAKIDGLAHIIGYVRYPQKDANGNYYKKEFEGVDGVEKTYNDYLTGKNGLKITETDAVGNVASESVIEPPQNGKNLELSIDAEFQGKLYGYIKTLAEEKGFKGGAAAFMNTETGELLSLTSYPEYNSQILSDADDRSTISKYNNDKRNVYLNRAISGLYTPGSIVKLIVSMGALTEKIISPMRQILSTGSISIPNIYFPDKPTVFTDWKAHGFVDMRHAIAVSSNVYFYEVCGGYKDQEGLGIERLNTYYSLFGYGKDTGIKLPNEQAGTIPNVEWKEKNFPGDPWRIGDTYYTSIGQYGFQATLIQATAATAAIANNGKLFVPSLEKNTIAGVTELGLNPSDFQIVREGMKEAVNSGTAKNLSDLPVSVAAKTGTAELGVSKANVNSWIVGFFPYDKPKYAFAVMMEAGDRHNAVGGLYVALQAIHWLAINRPQYIR